MTVKYTPTFIKEYKKLDKNLQEEVWEKIEFFKTNFDNKFLKVHKLKGQLKKFYSFSVNYKYRVIFEKHSKNEIWLYNVGDHSIYQ